MPNADDNANKPTRVFAFVCLLRDSFQPDDEIPAAQTEGLRSYYLTNLNEQGKVIQFTKVLLERDHTRVVDLPSKEEPGSLVYFEAVVDLPPKEEPGSLVYYEAVPLTETKTNSDNREVQPFRGPTPIVKPGNRLAYETTLTMTAYYEATVDETGWHCQATFYRKVNVFEDHYHIGPTAK